MVHRIASPHSGFVVAIVHLHHPVLQGFSPLESHQWEQRQGSGTVRMCRPVERLRGGTNTKGIRDRDGLLLFVDKGKCFSDRSSPCLVKPNKTALRWTKEHPVFSQKIKNRDHPVQYLYSTMRTTKDEIPLTNQQVFWKARQLQDRKIHEP